MGLFGKSFEEQVNAGIAHIRATWRGMTITAEITGDEIVTLKGEVPDLATKGAIMGKFNELVETKNTINQMTVAKAPDAPAAETPVETPPPAEPEETIHEVVSGDTLGAIAKKYYGNAGKYMKIFEGNRDILDNPDLIKVGQKLKIPTDN